MPSLNKRRTKAHPVADRAFFEDVDRLVVALRNLVERSSPPVLNAIPGWTPFLLVAMHATKTFYDATKYLIADSPPDPLRRLEYGLAVSPLIRFLVDLLFNIVFLRLRPRSLVKRYDRAGWLELHDRIARFENEYGSARKWRQKIELEKQSLEQLRRAYGISKRAPKNWKKLPSWPIPSQILRRERLPMRTKRFLNFIYSWMYRELSQDAHASHSGIVRIYSKLLLERDEGRETVLKRIKSSNAMDATALVLAICTEINDIGGFDRKDKLLYLWRILIEDWPDSKLLFKRRYKSMLLMIS